MYKNLKQSLKKSAANLGPMVCNVHGEGFEGLHILIWLHLKLALLADLCNIARGLLQLTQRLRQCFRQLYLFLHTASHVS